VHSNRNVQPVTSTPPFTISFSAVTHALVITTGRF